MSYLRNGFIALLGFLLVAGTIAQPLQAQSLEERVQQIEEKMQDDDMPADPYVDEFGGRIMADWTFNTSQSDNYNSQLGSDAEDGFEFRRVRFYAEGKVAENISYKSQIDFAGNAVDLKSVYINFEDLGILPHLKVGQFKEPFSLEEQTSSKYITFMSRTALTDGLSQARNPGFLTSDQLANGKLNYAVGVFTPDDQQQPATNGSYNLSGRLTSPIVANDDFSRLVHLGISGSLRGQGSGEYTSDLEPEVHKGDPEFLEVGIDQVTNSTALGVELATVNGPLSFQAEYAQEAINRTDGNEEPTLSSQYAMVSYLLTGEQRPYDPAAGDFGRISPNDPNGTGAWEVAARWSSTDYTEAKDITTITPSGSATANELAGQMDVLTLGMNWYPTSHSKWMVNYVDATQDDLDVDGQWVTTRFQVDF